MQEQHIVTIIVVIIVLMMLCRVQYTDHQMIVTTEGNGLIKKNENKPTNTTKDIENFFGGYYDRGYPYDFPFPNYYPFYYSGCNENVFGEINCLPKLSSLYYL
jgi:hypothetical protein